MSIEITARHVKVGEEFQDYARRRAETLMESFPKTEHVHVIMDHVKHDYMAEVVVQSKHHIRVEAAETSPNLRQAIDSAMDKMEKQLQKFREKIHDHKAQMKQAEKARQQD
jgi:putative sigma-54 modulation protein